MSTTLEIQPGDRLLVSRTDRLGDLILALPFVETLKRRYPDCAVDVLASLYASPILENNSCIDRIFRVQNDQLVSSRHYCKELEHKIKSANYKAVVVLYPQRKICRLFQRISLPNRLGTAGRFHSIYFTHRLMHSRQANQKHEFRYNLDFLKFFKGGETVDTPRVYPTEKELRNARRILDQAGISGRFILIHPGSGGSAERWPMEKFVELFQHLSGAGFPVILTGSSAEGEAVDRVAAKLGIAVNKITGQTDLRTLAAVLSQASTVVANSTGPLHLAVATGTRVVGLYPGKQIMSPVRWGPVGDGHRIIQPQTGVCKCRPRNCHCMETISVDQVAAATGEVYGSHASE